VAESDGVDDHVLARPAPPMGWRDRLERLADATGSTPGRLVAGTAVVVVAVAGGLWLTRPPSEPPEVALPFASTTAAALVTTSTSALPEVLVVHVAGAVAQPGVHELVPGARVIDAVNAAGGLAPHADGARVNLAAPVADGERVYVPAVGEPAPPPLAGGAAVAGGTAPTGPLDLNSATEAQLDDLPGVGPATAAAIVQHRDRIGGFTSVDQLLDVRGIGEAKLEQLRPLVRV
jgi:competence protein ComEA